MRRGQAPRLARRRAAADATTEPDPGPPPEAVFDCVTGPSPRRAALAMPGACEYEGP
jgi:hypothetical protein